VSKLKNKTENKEEKTRRCTKSIWTRQNRKWYNFIH